MQSELFANTVIALLLDADGLLDMQRSEHMSRTMGTFLGQGLAASGSLAPAGL